ncbi:RNA-binding protein [bacterium]|nr:RNA-binding protein [candidate division CSSED10-310 bacterium]
MDIYVGNLSFETKDSDLKKLFETYGVVDAVRIITDRDTGRSKGFAFIEMPDKSAAQQAIDNINGSEVHGRALRVNESTPKPQRDDRRGGGGGGGGRSRW